MDEVNQMAGDAARMTPNFYILVAKSEGKIPLGRRRRRSDDNKINLKEMDESVRPKDSDTMHDRVQGLAGVLRTR
jgi:hypothetical protein